MKTINKDTVIVSMTTYPARAASAITAMSSLLLQITSDMNVHPVLVLAEDEWPNKILPIEFNTLLPTTEILWTKDNLKAYNKFLPVMEKYPDNAVITFDDDKYYSYSLIENFIYDDKKQPEDIIWGRGAEVLHIPEDGSIHFVKLKRQETPEGQVTRRMKPYFGIVGTLYPAHVFKDKRFYDKEAIRKYDLTCDDSWVYSFALIGNIKMRRISRYIPDIRIQANQENALFKYNSVHYNDIWQNLLIYLPELKDVLEKIKTEGLIAEE
jgi:hypothetical protein